jgi:putative nucleotidyltransferase with HDIG domain
VNTQASSAFSGRIHVPRLIWTLILFLTVASVAIFAVLFKEFSPQEGSGLFTALLALGLSLTVALFIGVVMLHNYYVRAQRDLHGLIISAEEHARIEEETNEIIMRLNELVSEQAETEHKLNRELRVLFLETVRALVATLEARDEYTENHSLRVAHWALLLGRRFGMSDEELETLERAALLHDIGKVSVPDSILLKPARLTPEEFEVVKQHPSRGEEIVRTINLLHPARDIIRHHHERPDGNGYPDGLTELPLMVRIIAAVDCFDAMTSDRPYRKSMEYAEARARMLEVAERQLDGEVVSKLFDLFETTPEGYGTIAHIKGIPPLKQAEKPQGTEDV